MKTDVRNKAKANSTDVLRKYAPFILALVVFVIYLPAGKEFFALDDPQYVVNNEQIAHPGLSLFSTTINGNYHPLTLLSLALDFKLFKMSASGYHFTSLLLHTMNAILLFLFILRISRRSWVALVTALLFAAHPMHVESVAWISERKDVLYVFFYLASLLCYVNYVDAGFKRKDLGYTLLFFVLSLLSKGQAVTLPLALLLTDYLLQRKMDKRCWLEKLPFLALSLVFGSVAYYSQKDAGAVPEEIMHLPFFERILMACFALWNYLYKALLPVQLSVMHPYPAKTGGAYSFIVYLSPLLALGTLGLIAWRWRGNRNVVFGLGFFLVNIILLLQLIPVGGAIVAERYSYLSYAGLFYLAACGLYYLWERSSNRISLAAVLIFCLIVLTAVSHARNRMWSSNKKIWTNVTRHYPDLAYGYLKLGFIYYRESEAGSRRTKTDSAFINLDKAVQLGWRSMDVYGLRGDANAWRGRVDSAIADYNKALQYGDDPLIRYHRGILYMQSKKGDTRSNADSAIVDLKKVLKNNSAEPLLYFYLGNLYMRHSQKDSAAGYYKAALSRQHDPRLKAALEDSLKKALTAP